MLNFTLFHVARDMWQRAFCPRGSRPDFGPGHRTDYTSKQCFDP